MAKKWLALATVMGLMLQVQGCGTAEEDSTLNWSHVATEKALGSIPALLAFEELSFSRATQGIPVCIQESASYRGSHLLLETKLAYAAWLSASGKGSAAAWDRFDFRIAARCDRDDVNFSSHVIIASMEKPDISQSQDFTVIRCSDRSCLPRGYTAGWGGPGAVRYTYYTANPDLWSQVRLDTAAVARLSPYVRWQSLETELNLQLQARQGKIPGAPLPRLSTASLQSLLDRYLLLKAKAQTVSYADLVAFSEEIAARKLDSQASYKIVNITPDRDQANYQLQAAAFHTLLHEVGHQFGMMHAHVAASEHVSGAISGSDAVKSGDSWTTDNAAMAYNNSYFYLTADDKAGVRDLTSKLYPYLRARRE